MSSASVPPPRDSTSRSARRSSARRSRRTSERCASARNAEAAFARHTQRRAHLRLGLAGLQARDHLVGEAHPRGHPVQEPGQPLAGGAQLEVAGHRARPVAGDQRVGERPDLALGRAGGELLDEVGVDLRARPELQGELLELAQQALLALADAVHQRLRAAAVELEAQPARLLDRPLGQVPGLDRGLLVDRAARLLDELVQALGRLEAALLAREEHHRRLLGQRRHHRGEDLQVGVLPALDPLGDHEPPTHREGHRRQRHSDRLGRARLALEDLDAARSRALLCERAQLGAALGEPAVVVAVDQIGGLEGRQTRAGV